ncbi:RPII140-upstream gene protein-like [Eriocheir sinensis]|uniref:RPII140-upstream gene protein-like n=1 Tax=Eriocheir sinensis TaxID=95602 RepID=UPI0021C7F38F|nr:RPII140-upstream gene protein-like [Eriocheir sinensis]
MAGRGGERCSKLYRAFLASGGGRGTTLGLLPVLFESPDKVDPNTRTALSHLSDRGELTGMQRLKFMFSYDGYGNLSPELSMVMQSGLMGVLTGTLIGGTIHSRESYLTFLERNQGTAFQNVFEAQKELQNKVTVGFGRGAFIWGWRLGLFCSTFMLFTSSIATYRGKSSVIEYSAGGTITGAIFKLKNGPKPAIAGAVMGGALGTIAGCVNLALLALSGTTNDQLRKYHYEWYEHKQEERLKSLHAAREKDTDTLSLQHNSKVNPDLDPLAGVTDETPEPKANSNTDTNTKQ